MHAWDAAAARAEVGRLVGEFERSHAEGRSAKLTEEETKKNYILPLFRALGWRVDTSEVSAEERVLRGRADFGFRIGGVTKFYVEAKSAQTEVWNREFCQQVIDYSYAKGVSWAVLSNFAKTIVLYADARTPNPFNALFFELTANQYVAEFDQLRLIGREAVASRELDAKAEKFGRKPKKQPIDKQLLADLNDFRLDLAKDIRRLNIETFGAGGDSPLEETVQRLLDRLIFIRVAEDRGLEDKQLQLIAQGSDATALKRLRELFLRYDQNFDSKLFQPHAADEVRLDGELLQRVVTGLHHTRDDSIRYDFDAIDADVLGVMYEQYLGLLLRQTAKRTKLDSGSVNRKEQGIYYTPTWVVDYIVRYSIEEALRRKGAKPETLRVLDPACGSGTFLLRAFDQVLRARNPGGERVQQRFDPEKVERMESLRSSILTQNLFGVDLDARAVEIAQLNLMIRAAESRHRLPTLERNVRVGNSVIADPSVDPRALDWAKVFPDAMSDGGFDAIVTNPPYVRIQNLGEQAAAYLAERYHADWNFDLYTTFVQQAWELLREGGVAGFILPNKWMNSNYGESLRAFLGKNGAIRRLIDFKDYQVFEGATTYTCLLFLRKSRAQSKFLYGSLPPPTEPASVRVISDEVLGLTDTSLPKDPSVPWALVPAPARPLFDRLDLIRPRLRDVAESIFVGLQTSADDVYIVSVKSVSRGVATVRNGTDEDYQQIEERLVRPLLKSGDMRRWGLGWKGLSLIFPYIEDGGSVRGITAEELAKDYPLGQEYFRRYEETLKSRENGKGRTVPNWHLYLYNKSLDKFPLPRIFTPNLSPFGCFSFNTGGKYAFVGGVGGGYGIVLKDRSEESFYFVLGVLNSRPVQFYHHLVSSPFQGGWFSNARQFIEPLPIPVGTPERRRAIASAARRLSELTAKLQSQVPGTDGYRAGLEGIREVEGQLDRMALELFEITHDESALLPPLPNPR